MFVFHAAVDYQGVLLGQKSPGFVGAKTLAKARRVESGASRADSLS